MVYVLNDTNSVANHFLAEIRDVGVQQDRMRFRRNLERLGELLAYEISKTMQYKSQKVTTPLGQETVELIQNQIVLITILRAGVPFFNGFLNYFDNVECGFVGAYRKNEASPEQIEIAMGYTATPNIVGKELLVVDPMLATGKSLLKTVNQLIRGGTPSYIHFISAISSPEGIKYIQDQMDSIIPYHIWTCAVDKTLNDKAFIIPGLGDAGDLSFGPKE